jgi:hypothetical protein
MNSLLGLDLTERDGKVELVKVLHIAVILVVQGQVLYLSGDACHESRFWNVQCPVNEHQSCGYSLGQDASREPADLTSSRGDGH